ncbi:MAG: DUF362 domain-containing protein [Anaerolineales bacterium]|nr:MAG: DUF362 domain-containing protein [Anaerolineales bacterium]
MNRLYACGSTNESEPLVCQECYPGSRTDDQEAFILDRRSFIRVSAPFVGSILGAQALSGCRRALGLIPSRTPTNLPSELASNTPPPFPTSTNFPAPTPTTASDHAAVVLVKTEDRHAGMQKALSILEAHDFQGKRMLVKPNLNSSHAAPGSTHNDVLATMVEWLDQNGAGQITVGDRSGMENTRRVMDKKGLPAMADELGFDLIAFDELAADEWIHMGFEGSHWPSGFALARPVHDAEGIVSLCCLKTHRFGGHFTLSLKNSVGMVAYQVPGEGVEYMTQLHNSAAQRYMIAEINRAYTPDLIVLDAVDAFLDGGPESGTLAHPGLILAGTDRVAIDAVGVALLRYFGTTPEVQQGLIFHQAQIEQAVALGLGVDDPHKIDLITDDPESSRFVEALRPILLQG